MFPEIPYPRKDDSQNESLFKINRNLYERWVFFGSPGGGDDFPKILYPVPNDSINESLWKINKLEYLLQSSGGGGGATGPTGPSGPPGATGPSGTVCPLVFCPIGPFNISADENDYAPAGFATCSLLKISPQSSGLKITGLDGGSDGRIVLVQNVSPVSIILATADGGSLSANRFGLSVDYVLSPNSYVLLEYDGSRSKWRSLPERSFAGNMAFDGILEPPEITSDQDNYSPSGLPNAAGLLLESDAVWNITGIVPDAGTVNPNGRILFIHNIGLNDLVLKNESLSSAADYRFALVADITLAPNAMVLLQYDYYYSQRWRAIQSVGPTGPTGPSGPTGPTGATGPSGTPADLSGAIVLSGETTPSVLTADVNDYGPFANVSTVNIDTDGNGTDNFGSNGTGWTITGIAGGTTGLILRFFNVGAGGQGIRFTSEDLGSAASNRITTTAGNILLLPFDAIILRYNGTRWEVFTDVPLGGDTDAVFTTQIVTDGAGKIFGGETDFVAIIRKNSPSGRATGQTAANANVAQITTGANDNSYRVSMNMRVNSATAISTSMKCTYTDTGGTSRAMIFPVEALTGSFVALGAVAAVGVWHTPLMHIRAKAGTTITLATSAGTFNTVNYDVEGLIEQITNE